MLSDHFVSKLLYPAAKFNLFMTFFFYYKGLAHFLT